MTTTQESSQVLPSVLVGIVTHNRAEILPKAIDSALAQKGCRFKVSVIDDGSTDATSELARRYPDVEWIRWDSNRGLMTARNHWMSTEGFDYFVSLDDDAWFLQEDEVALAVDFMEQQPNVAAVAFDILSPDRMEPVQRQRPRRTGVFIGCGHVLKLQMVRQVGVYDSVPGSYGGEEKDLCLRLINAGCEIMLMPGVHIWHDKTMLARDFAAQHRSVVCNDLVMTVRRTPVWLLPLVLPAKGWKHWGHAWRCRMIGACLAGFEMFVRALPAVMRSRQPVSLKALWTFRQLSRGVLPASPYPADSNATLSSHET